MEQIEVYQRESQMLKAQLRHTLKRLHDSKGDARTARDRLRRDLDKINSESQEMCDIIHSNNLCPLKYDEAEREIYGRSPCASCDTLMRNWEC